jgi:hypothetical protein
MPQGERAQGLRVLWADVYEVLGGGLSTPARHDLTAALAARWTELPPWCDQRSALPRTDAGFHG